MEQLSFFDPVDKAIPGAKWWAGNWQCRNFHGFLQQREDGRCPWQFVIYAFGECDAAVYAVDGQGKLVHTSCAMDHKDNLVIRGKRYGRRYWCH